MEAFRLMPPLESDAKLARTACSKMIPFARHRLPLVVSVVDAEASGQITLPADAVTVLTNVLEAMAAGHGITIIPQHAELTTMEAADILNVSRPYLIKLLESGEIEYRKVGRHRRITMENLLAYKMKSDKASRAAMDELVALSEELGLYDL